MVQEKVLAEQPPLKRWQQTAHLLLTEQPAEEPGH